ncbi:MAG TPA: hypothetical protein VMA77_32235 [Solirubrobacteraceae bacterium]|nr:hypothetical protein [Solirubrobacteraceae bacterium]
MIEQADLVEALWAHDGWTSTRMVVHDYGSSVGQELLARRSDGSLSVTMTDMTLMNGGIYPELHRRTEKQSRFLDPVVGPVESAQYTEGAFVSDLAVTFAPDYDALVDSEEMWRSSCGGFGTQSPARTSQSASANACPRSGCSSCRTSAVGRRWRHRSA